MHDTSFIQNVEYNRGKSYPSMLTYRVSLCISLLGAPHSLTKRTTATCPVVDIRNEKKYGVGISLLQSVSSLSQSDVKVCTF